LCYVDHHDRAYQWAERRRLEIHPKTGAAQFVEVRETVREIEIPQYVDGAVPGPASKQLLFDGVSEDTLLGYGVPAEWLADVQRATEDSLFEIAEHLPAEAAEALLELATGNAPPPSIHTFQDEDPFAHPDAQRRFRMVTDVEELRRALEYPWDKWTVFLHPAQRALVERRNSGPARVSGSAGTGKTIVALHRAALLARARPGAKVLLTTFSDTLARTLRQKLQRLVGSDSGVADRITVTAIDRAGLLIYESAFGVPAIADERIIRSLLREASESAGPHRFTQRFVETEWRDVVDAWQLSTWESYRDIRRLGRKTRLGENQRAALWSIFDRVRSSVAARGLLTTSGMFAIGTQQLLSGGHKPFDFVVVDESQDMGVPQLRFLAALAGDRPDGLFFAGDLGQRIFQTPFSWRALGVDVRGRSETLRINYRTSHQIRCVADRLIGEELSDVDGNTEVRRGTVSAFDGAEPIVWVLESVDAERVAIAEWLRSRTSEGVLPHEIAVFVRSEAELERARRAVEASGLKAHELDGTSDGEMGAVAICTMHLAKGLEFRAVAVAGCDDEIVPLQSRIENVGNEADLEDIYETERHLLYVACTRARDYLLVTAVRPASEFLDDLRPQVGLDQRP
jgi:superfamily I DNA/RNA helicase